jgi:threonine/homoserine/homoserine lactone efflux protein
MIVYLVIGITYGFAAAVQPGPFSTYLATQTLKNGWRKTLPAVFSPLISDIPIAILTLYILNSISHSFIKWLHLLGGLFIIYLAVGAYKSWKKLNSSDTSAKETVETNILKGALVNLLNPNPYLGWSFVMGPLIVEGWRQAPLNSFALVISFYITMFTCLIILIFLLHQAKKIGARVNYYLLAASFIALAFFGIYQLLLGITA